MQSLYPQNKYDLIKRVFFRFYKIILSILIVQTVISIIGVIIPYFVKLQFDYLQGINSWFLLPSKRLWVFSILLTIPFIIENIRLFIFEKVTEKLFHKSSFNFETYVSNYIWEKFKELDWGFFANKRNDRLIANVTNSATNFGRDSVDFFTSRASDITIFATIVPIIGFLDMKILLLCLFFGFLQVLITYYAKRHEILFALEQDKVRDERWKVESLLRYDFPNLKILGAINKYLNYYQEKTKRHYEVNLNQALIRFKFKAYGFLLKNSLNLFIGIIIGLEVLKGSLTIGDYTLITAYILQITNVLSNIVQSLRDWHEIDIQFDRINFVFILKPRILVNKTSHKLDLSEPKKIELKSVSFTYPDLREEERIYISNMIKKTEGILKKFAIGGYQWELKDWQESLEEEQKKKQVLSNVSLKIEKGKITALLGRNGAGKTTITNLILHGLEANSGNIYIDDIDIRNIPFEKLFEIFSVIQQNPFLLWRYSIRENIIIGTKTKISDKKIWEVLDSIDASNFIRNLPEKLDTIIGEDYSLSGGEQQLLVLARIFLQKRPFIIFDEGTNQLDVEHDTKVFNQLRQLKENSGILFITHRITTARKADYIYILDNGRIVEEGVHNELLKIKDGLYRKFWNLQVVD